MRICVYDNLANNAYIITKVLRKNGYDAELGLNPDDTFPMSQPIWEELDFEMPVNQFSNKSIADWLEFEKEKGWKKPDWVRYIGRPASSRGNILRDNSVTALTHARLALKAVARCDDGFYGLLNGFTNLTRVRDISDYDFVIGFGLGPSLAYLAGVKYASIPFGGDLIIIPFQTDDANWRIRERAKLQRIAYQKSDVILVGADPTYLDALKRIDASKNLHYYAFPVDPVAYAPSKKIRLEDLIEPQMTSRTKNKIVMLMPSRVDFQAKGTDKVLRAFAKLVRERKDVFLIMLGWGLDLEKAVSMVSELGINEHIYFHPYVVSKRRLVKLINATDIILDQFAAGAYGTTTMETMACGKPLITYIEWDNFKTFLPEKPPIVKAETEEDLLQGMIELCNSESREKVGKAARDWILSYHSERNFSNLMKTIITQISETKKLATWS